MKILLVQGTPVPLRRYLPEHVVTTAYEQGWSGLENGELLREAEEAGYELLVTTDQNLRYHQNLNTRGIDIVVLVPRLGLGSKNAFEKSVTLSTLPLRAATWKSRSDFLNRLPLSKKRNGHIPRGRKCDRFVKYGEIVQPSWELDV